MRLVSAQQAGNRCRKRQPRRPEATAHSPRPATKRPSGPERLTSASGLAQPTSRHADRLTARVWATGLGSDERSHQMRPVRSSFSAHLDSCCGPPWVTLPPNSTASEWCSTATQSCGPTSPISSKDCGAHRFGRRGLAGKSWARPIRRPGRRAGNAAGAPTATGGIGAAGCRGRPRMPTGHRSPKHSITPTP